MTDYIQIRIKENIDAGWSNRLAGLELVSAAGGGTLISGCLPDQSALHGVLESIRDLNLTLISVTCTNQQIKGEK